MYGKFFESAFTGSMFGAGINVFAVWGYIIAHCKQDSRVEINPDLVAVVLGTDRKQVDDALDYLSSPDPKSRNKEYEGRRIVKESEYTWLVVNHSLYRNIRTSDELRQYNRERKQISRQRKMSSVKSSQDQCHSIQKTDTDKQKTDTTKTKHTYGESFEKFWSEYPKKVAKNEAWKAWRRALLPPLEELLRILEIHKKSQKWRDRDGEFIPYAATWINGKRWEDEISEDKKSTYKMSADVAEALGIKT